MLVLSNKYTGERIRRAQASGSDTESDEDKEEHTDAVHLEELAKERLRSGRRKRRRRPNKDIKRWGPCIEVEDNYHVRPDGLETVTPAKVPYALVGEGWFPMTAETDKVLQEQVPQAVSTLSMLSDVVARQQRVIPDVYIQRFLAHICSPFMSQAVTSTDPEVRNMSSVIELTSWLRRMFSVVEPDSRGNVWIPELQTWYVLHSVLQGAKEMGKRLCNQDKPWRMSAQARLWYSERATSMRHVLAIFSSYFVRLDRLPGSQMSRVLRALNEHSTPPGVVQAVAEADKAWSQKALEKLFPYPRLQLRRELDMWKAIVSTLDSRNRRAVDPLARPWKRPAPSVDRPPVSGQALVLPPPTASPPRPKRRRTEPPPATDVIDLTGINEEDEDSSDGGASSRSNGAHHTPAQVKLETWTCAACWRVVSGAAHSCVCGSHAWQCSKCGTGNPVDPLFPCWKCGEPRR